MWFSVWSQGIDLCRPTEVYFKCSNKTTDPTLLKIEIIEETAKTEGELLIEGPEYDEFGKKLKSDDKKDT